MARSWHYPRWRRVVMQVVLWGVLGLALGLARLEVRHRQRVGSVELRSSQATDLGGGARVGVRLPAGWVVEHDAAEHPGEGEDPSVLFVAHEPDGGGGGRTLVVRCRRLAGPMTATAFLGQSGLLRDSTDADPDPDERVEGDRPTAGTLDVAGTAGVWLQRVPLGRGLVPGPATRYVAGGVVPPAWGVSVVLDCPADGPDPDGDRDVLRRVAAAITVTPGG